MALNAISTAPESYIEAVGLLTMEFGDRSLVGAQFELNCDVGGTWLFGRFCYWINGTRLGDYNLGTSLRDVFFSMKWIVADRGNRQGDLLCDLPAEQAFQLLDATLYGSDEVVASASLPQTPARFDIRPPVDIFDGWKIYLIECHGYDRFLYSRLAPDASFEIFKAPRGIFDTVIKDAYDYLEHLYESHAS